MLDTELVSVAKRAIKAGATGDILKAVDVFSRDAEAIALQIRKDATRRGLLGLWGKSLNVDEFTATEIVEAVILNVIGHLAAHKMSGVTPHAGLQHTYGYLFSLIETPYGYKRSRWTSPEMERGFGLSADVLSPNPNQGTLLTNATWLAGQIAFRSERQSLWMNRCLGDHVHSGFQSIAWRELQSVRLIESVDFKSRNGRQCSVRLRTDVVRYPQPSAQPHLLVYSVEDSRNRYPQLITLFSVTEEFLEELLSREGRRDDIRTRYNAHVPAVTGQQHSGHCTVTRQN